ncbi:TonB-dependent receptor [Desulfuromonas thiophila]|uniref:TonB-dependent receptor plug domain-containing protein n=1 Tax=Desulfuromonas thiophila TaxID=57664 RepID=UPI0029F538F0|nr:TonB-dependent receptor [Desulfuromonas thiophila]
MIRRNAHRRLRSRLTLLALLGSLVTPALAEPLPLQAEPLVVTATRTESALAEAPGSIEVIDAASLRQMNARTLADALEYATGLVIATETGRTLAPSIRGTSAKHCLVLVDGRRLVVGYGDLVDINQIPLTLVERIEVVRGPASALYGSDALGGVVNIITRQPGSGPAVQLEGQTGINKDGEGEAWLGSAAGSARLGALGLLAGVEGRGKQPWNRIDDDGMDDGDDLDLTSGGGRFHYELAAGQSLRGGYDYSNRSMAGDRPIENLQRLRDTDAERQGGYLQYDARLAGGDQLSLLLNRSEYREDLSLSPAAHSTEEGFKKNVLNQVEARYSGLFFKRHLLSSGFEWREDRREGTKVDSRQVENLSLYLQDEFRLFEALQLVVGLRYDDHETFGGQWSPRLSLIYHLSERWRLKASYGEGFRAPSLTELYVTSWRQKGKQIYQPNADLDAESSRSAELGVEGQLGVLRTGLTLFYTEVDDLIEALYQESRGSGKNAKDYYRFANIGEARLQGIEWDGRLALPLGLSLAGQATWLDAENRDSGEDLDGQPEFKGHLKLAWDHAGLGLHGNVRLQYFGQTPYASGDEGDDTLTHLYLSKTLGEHLEGFGGIDNLFDQDAVEPTFFYVGLRARF